ncbi:MAG: DUF6938 domain-containing protein [Patescibacteria group bacterium]
MSNGRADSTNFNQNTNPNFPLKNQAMTAPNPTSEILDPALQKTFLKDKAYLESTKLPIITVSATYKEDLKGLHQLKENDRIPDFVFSRAHYSMALAAAVHAWKGRINPQKAWIVDPSNYVAHQDWFNILLTDAIGRTLARQPLLKKLKDVIDKFGRQKLPILKSITPPLIYLTKDIERPILSFHIASGNIIAQLGKKVIQVVTDPHVREDYLVNADLPNIRFCVFDERTKHEFLEKAHLLGKKVNPNRVIVTGPPVDPRIIAARSNKQPWESHRPLRLCLTTGGLGTNKPEIERFLQQILPAIKEKRLPIELMVYAGTHQDICDLTVELARVNNLRHKLIKTEDPANFEIGSQLNHTQQTKLNPHSHLTILHHPQIVDANELLIRFAFPWADGFITKPSGDMAYDAAAAGCFLLTLEEWGEWEYNIRAVFEGLGIAQKIQAVDAVGQLQYLMGPAALGKIYNPKIHFQPWITVATRKAHHLEPLFLHGIKKIVDVAKE